MCILYHIVLQPSHTDILVHVLHHVRFHSCLRPLLHLLSHTSVFFFFFFFFWLEILPLIYSFDKKISGIWYENPAAAILSWVSRLNTNHEFPAHTGIECIEFVFYEMKSNPWLDWVHTLWHALSTIVDCGSIKMQQPLIIRGWSWWQRSMSPVSWPPRLGTSIMFLLGSGT